jgi:type I restriction enzyme R subunit
VSEKEATARIKINKLLETAGWRFFPEGDAPANIRLETTVAIKPADLAEEYYSLDKLRKAAAVDR